MRPALINGTNGTTKTIPHRAIGTNKKPTSERKTTPVNTSRDTARRSLDPVGDARAGVFGIKKERATLTSAR